MAYRITVQPTSLNGYIINNHRRVKQQNFVGTRQTCEISTNPITYQLIIQRLVVSSRALSELNNIWRQDNALQRLPQYYISSAKTAYIRRDESRAVLYARRIASQLVAARR